MIRRRFGWMLLAAAGVAHAEPPLPIAVPDGRALREYDNAWLVTVRYKDGRVDERSISSDHVRFRTIAGKRYLTRIEGTTAVLGRPDAMPAGNLSLTFNIFDPATVAPLHGEAASSDGDAAVTAFDPGHVVTRTRPAAGGAERSATADVREPYFDVHGGMTGLLLAALPLRAGYRAQLPGFADGAIDATPIAVTGRETIAAGKGRRVACWRVAVGAAPAPATYWISNGAPYVIRVEVRAANATATWSMM